MRPLSASWTKSPSNYRPILPSIKHACAPSEIGDETHQPGGELHSIAAKEEEQLPEPPLETESDAGGVPLSYGKDQAGDLPEELEQGLPEPPPEPRGSVYPQPVSISLNEA